jgi:hypothetical protein
MTLNIIHSYLMLFFISTSTGLLKMDSNNNNKDIHINFVKHKFIWLQCVNLQLANGISNDMEEISDVILHVNLKIFKGIGTRSL